MMRETIASKDFRSVRIKISVEVGVRTNAREEVGTNAQASVAAAPAKKSRRLADWFCGNPGACFFRAFWRLPVLITLIEQESNTAP
jgi:hypothetical protein